MNRIEVIQQIIDAIGARSYLELGVWRGETFLPVRARRKVAVDPCFQIRWQRRWRWFYRNLNSKYHALTSDEFFRQAGAAERFDVVFIDGLHTYRQALRDVENALARLAPGGVIVMHDCNPPTAAAAHPGTSPAQVAALNLPGWDWSWCGDVWKTVCHLRSQRRDLNVFVLDCDYGLGIVTRGHPEGTLPFALDELEGLTFADLDQHRREFLNLQPPSRLADFLARRQTPATIPP